VAFSPDGSTLAVTDDNNRTYLWNMSWPVGLPVVLPKVPAVFKLVLQP
jgi:WD40 repeat protein